MQELIITSDQEVAITLKLTQRPEDLMAISKGLLSPFKSQVHEAKMKSQSQILQGLWIRV